MSDKVILTIAYSAVSALGLWLLFDVPGGLAKFDGFELILFAGAGLGVLENLGKGHTRFNYHH